ncbi:MAG: hypothetical protein KJ804_14265 [Proteobacteria bacterium]|nr:hypothetical protein [Pseudomonadota bacterium]MBU1059474.1 hypothetical protein [Pseudomonadota bacterium]
MKNKLSALCLANVLFFSTAIMASDKVVIIPMGATTNIEASINWQGEWADGVPYANGDAVQYQGSSYLCVANHISSPVDSPPHAYWDLVASVGAEGGEGPAGPKGDTGDTGSQGPAGVQGDAGDTGPQGPAGVQGDTGDTGPQGIKGDTGDIGPQGPAGADGITGPAGVDGVDGVDGINCWDLNGNGACDLKSEDVDKNGFCTVLDCQGPEGPAGPVAGTDGQLVYNDNGSAAGSEIYYDKSTDNVGIGVVPTSSYQLSVTGDVTDSATGLFENISNSSVGWALYGNAFGNGGTTHYGVYGTASGATTNYAGYFKGDTVITGNAAIGTTPLTSTRLKVEATTENIGTSLAGFYNNPNNSTGSTSIGLQSEVKGVGGVHHYSISGEASGAETDNIGGKFNANGDSTNYNMGAAGDASGSQGLNIGGNFSANSAVGIQNRGVAGYASSGSENYGGYFESFYAGSSTDGSVGYGAKGKATGGYSAFGVYGEASDAVYSYGVYGISSASNGIGVYGQSSFRAGYFAGDVYVTKDVSALSFTDRTPYPKDIQTAYDAVLSMQRLPEGEYDAFDKENQLDHSTLHEFVKSKDGEHRDLSATVSAQNEVIKDLIKRIAQLEAQQAAQ